MKSVVITGSTRGIGLCMSKEFLKAGCNVTLSGRGVLKMIRRIVSFFAFGERVFCVSIMPILHSILILLLVMTMQSNSYVFAQETTMRLDVPSFVQYWQPWRGETVGFGSNDILNGGCALTSLSMVLKYYGIDTNPSRLNVWLKENNGYIGSAIRWGKVSEIDPSIARFLQQVDYTGLADINLIKSEIDNGYPVIAKMSYNGSHYVVICGYAGDTFYINDPWTENAAKTINEETLFDSYQNPAKAIKGIVRFRGSNLPAKVPVFEIKSQFIDYEPGAWEPIIIPDISVVIGNPVMTVGLDQKEIDQGLGTYPIIKDGRTLLPVRALLEEMGGEVIWEGSSKKVTIKIKGRLLEFWVNKRSFYTNGAPDVLEVAPEVINGRTMMPLRQIFENIGCRIDWDASSSKVTVKSGLF